MKRWTVYLLAGLLSLLAFGFAQAPKAGGTLVMASQSEPDLWDPQRVTSALAFQMQLLMYDTLVVLDFDVATIQSHVATAWTVSPDGLTYTFTLRDDVKFHGGRAMTAEDWVWTFDRLLNATPPSPSAWRMGQVASITAPDATTLVIELVEPNSELLLQLTMPFLAVLDSEKVEALGERYGIEGGGGTGPFTFVRWNPGQELVMERNPDYTWGPSIHENTGPAYIERIVRRQIPELTTYLFELELGNVDLALGLPPTEVDRLASTPGVQVVEVAPRPSVEFLAFKITRPLMADVRVRRALQYAIDRQELAETVWFGQANVPTGILLPTTPGYSVAAEALWPFDDAQRARALLDEAGWVPGPDGIRVKDGERLVIELLIANSALNQELSAFLQQMWRDVGVATNIQIPDLSAFWGISRTEVYDVLFLNYGFSSGVDILGTYFRSVNIPAPNRMMWNDPRTDELLDIATKAVDEATKIAALQEVQEIVAEAGIYLPVVSVRSFLGASAEVRDLRANGQYLLSLGKLLDTWLDD
jgi:ABC-type transport system substrate-binding protein